MASIGNNVLASNAELRDAFMSPTETVYNAQLLDYIRRGKNIDMISGTSVGKPMVMRLYEVVFDKILNATQDTVAIARYNAQLKFLLHIYRGEAEDQNFANDYRKISSIDNTVKILLAETIMEFVEMGLFTEGQMEFVEIQLNIVLCSIEDLQPEMIKEREISDIFM